MVEGNGQMKFHHELDYDASPGDVRAMLADTAFRELVCQEQRITGCTVSIEVAGSQMTVVIDTTRPVDGIPGFARKIVGDTIQIVQSEDWSGATEAVLEVSIPGKPGRLQGSITLVEAGPGSVQTVTGDLRVAIPIVGGKLEGLVGDLLAAALRVEHRVGRRWLAGER